MAIGVQVWSNTPASNATADTNINWAEGMSPSAVNDSARSLMASVGKWRDDNNGTLATSGTSTAFTVVTNQVEGALTAGFTVGVQFHITANTAATLAVDGLTAKPLQAYVGQNLLGGEFGGGSIHHFTYSTTGTGQWVLQSPPTYTVMTNSLSGDTASISSAAYVDGPTIAVATTGVWYASGTVTIIGVSGNGNALFKLWDGTTVIASAATPNVSTILNSAVSLSGVISQPAANVKISATGSGGANFKMIFNGTGNSKDSTLTVCRIG